MSCICLLLSFSSHRSLIIWNRKISKVSIAFFNAVYIQAPSHLLFPNGSYLPYFYIINSWCMILFEFHMLARKRIFYFMLFLLICKYMVILNMHSDTSWNILYVNCQIINKCIIFCATPKHTLWFPEKKFEGQIWSAISWFYAGIYT